MTTPSAVRTALAAKLVSDGWAALGGDWTSQSVALGSLFSAHWRFVRLWPVGILTRANVFHTVCDVELELLELVSALATPDTAGPILGDRLPPILLPDWWRSVAGIYALETDGDPTVESFERVTHGLFRAVVTATIVLDP